MKHWKTVIAALCICSFLALAVNAISIRGLLGLDDEEEKSADAAEKGGDPAAPAPTNWARTAGPAQGGAVDLSLVKRLLANLEDDRRKVLLADEEAFTRFVRQEANNHSVIAAARANKLEEDPNTVFLMQRGAENILREIYLNRLIKEKLPEGFPSGEQVREYFENNRDNFVVPEKVHIWQIFFPVTEDMDEAAVKALRAKAASIAGAIRAKKTDFNGAAASHSEHVPSKVNGGYMGLIKTDDLKPAIREAVLALAEGEISNPLMTDTGIHVVKRGAIVPERRISLEDGRTQIRNLLIKQVRAQLRQAIFEQAAKSYPVDLSDRKIEEWRLRLRTRLESSAAE